MKKKKKKWNFFLAALGLGKNNKMCFSLFAFQ